MKRAIPIFFHLPTWSKQIVHRSRRPHQQYVTGCTGYSPALRMAAWATNTAEGKLFCVAKHSLLRSRGYETEQLFVKTRTRRSRRWNLWFVKESRKVHYYCLCSTRDSSQNDDKILARTKHMFLPFVGCSPCACVLGRSRHVRHQNPFGIKTVSWSGLNDSVSKNTESNLV